MRLESGGRRFWSRRQHFCAGTDAWWRTAGPARPRPGRAPIGRDVRELILRLTRENPRWSYQRIVGDLERLGVKVRNLVHTARIYSCSKPLSRSRRLTGPVCRCLPVCTTTDVRIRAWDLASQIRSVRSPGAGTRSSPAGRRSSRRDASVGRASSRVPSGIRRMTRVHGIRRHYLYLRSTPPPKESWAAFTSRTTRTGI
jgi:hypothetical protein